MRKPMKFEDAMKFLRSGYRIYRISNPEDYLEGTEEKPFGSFYLTLFDVLADDWHAILIDD